MNVSILWFAGWPSVGRVAFVCVFSFLWTLALIRFFGKRTISKMNPSDFVITVAIGSTLSSFIVSKDISFAEGLVALSCLVFLQFATEFVTQRVTRVRSAAEGHGTLVFHRGRCLQDAMDRENINENEIRKAVREKGITDLESVYAVILEIDGSLSVIPEAHGRRSALKDVKGAVVS